MFLLVHSVSHSTVPYSRWSGTIFLPSEHSCLTAVHKDGLGSSQAPPTTVSPLRLVSYGVIQATDYEATISSSRWEVQVPYPTYRVRSLVSPIHTLDHLSCLCTWRSRGVHHVNGGSWWWSMTSFTVVNPPVGNLNNHNSQGEGVICCLTSECLNLLYGEGTKRMCEPSSNYERD